MVTLRWIRNTLERTVQQTRRIRYRTVVLLAILVLIATAVFIAAIVADNDSFWKAAGPVFFLAAAGIVVYVLRALGIFEATASMIVGNLRSARPASSEIGDDLEAQVEQEVALRLVSEKARIESEIGKVECIFGLHLQGIVEEIKRDVLDESRELTSIQGKLLEEAENHLKTALNKGYEPARRHVGRILEDRNDGRAAEQLYFEGVRKCEIEAAFLLGVFHGRTGQQMTDDELLTSVWNEKDVVAAYVIGRGRGEKRLEDADQFPDKPRSFAGWKITGADSR